jgi:cytochrome c556
MKKFKLLLLTVPVIFASSSYYNLAQADKTKQLIKYRQNTMNLLSTNSKMIKAVLTQDINSQHLLQLATSMTVSASMIKGNYPEGSDFGDTDAKETIWENKADFDTKIKNLENATSNFLSAVKQKAANAKLMESYKSLGKSCKSCHKKYREK